MLTGTSLQSIGALKRIRPENPHFPPIICLRTDNRNPPISRPIRKCSQPHPPSDLSHLCFASLRNGHRYCPSRTAVVSGDAPDIEAMKRYGLDLSSYEQAALEPWPKDNVALFKRWMDEGLAA